MVAARSGLAGLIAVREEAAPMMTGAKAVALALAAGEVAA